MVHEIDDAQNNHDGPLFLTQVVAGDGGVGKTQLATWLFRRAFTNNAEDTFQVDLGVWVTAATRDAILSVYADAYTATHAGSPDSGQVQARAEAFLRWLATTSRSWLVILDDVADLDALEGLWPDGPAGRVIVTTRRRDSAMIARGSVIEVGVFTPGEALSYLKAKLDRPGLPRGATDQAAELARDLGYLPLALAQACAIIINEALTCATYRNLFADRTRTLAQVFPADPRASGDDYAHALSSTWSMASERADALEPPWLTRGVLSLAALLDPNGIPEGALLSAAARRYVAGGKIPHPGRVTAADARHALRNARHFSLLVHDPDAEPRAVRMHALAQRATLETLSDEDVETAITAAADALMEVWPSVTSDPQTEQVLRANATVLAGRHERTLWLHGMHPVLQRAGTSLGEVGLSAQAAAYFSRLAGDAKRLLGPDHPDVLEVRQHLARWLGHAGDTPSALAMYEMVLADYERVLGADHAQTMKVRSKLAWWQGESGNWNKAASLFRLLLADYERVFGADDPRTLNARGDLAFWIAQAGDPTSAVAMGEALLPDFNRVFGADHPDTFRTRGGLAFWRGQTGDIEGAISELEALLADRVRVLGADHPVTFGTRGDLAGWRGESGDLTGAVAGFSSLLADRLRVLGASHPDTHTTKHNVAFWQGQIGNKEAAIAAYEELLVERVQILGSEYPDTLASRLNLAWLRGETGDPAAAVAEMEMVLADSRRALGEDHSDTLVARADLAFWRGKAGDAAGAIAELEALVIDQLRVRGPDDRHSLSTRYWLAWWRNTTSPGSATAAELEIVLTDAARVLGANFHETLRSRITFDRWRERAPQP